MLSNHPIIHPILGRSASSALLLGVLVVLMSIPEFDPGSVKGGSFGTALMVLWGCGLLVWALGIVGGRGPRLRGKAASLAIGVLAVMFGALPWIPAPYAIQIGIAGLSAAMVHAAWRDRGHETTSPVAYRGPKCRVLLNTAGLLGIAMIIHTLLRTY